MFNIIHHETGLKIDLWILKNGPFDRAAFARRQKVKTLGIDLSVLSAEDLLLNKLLWYKVSEIEKHFKDAAGIYKVQQGKLDKPYLSKWGKKLKLDDILKKVLGN